jgi:hypothetical protein
LTHLTPHFPHRLLQPRDLLALVFLLFRHFADRSPRPLKLRVLLGPRPTIRLSKQAEPLILPRQLPPQVRNHRLKPGDLDVRVLRNEFGNLPPELDELEFPAQRLEIDCVSHPDFRRRPSTAAKNSRKCAPGARERTSRGLSSSLRSLGKQLARRYEGSPRDPERLALEDELRRGRRFVASSVML